VTAYKVVGPRAVLGHEPGEEFDADLPEAQATQLIRAGHIAEAGATKLVEDEDNESEEDYPEPDTTPGADLSGGKE
jgi:hypothetical protein